MRERLQKAVKRRFNRMMASWLGTIVRVDTPRNWIALTFDDGPHPAYTTILLDILAEYNAKATFFVIGKTADSNRDIVRRMIVEGHAVGNHSWNHASFHLLSGKQRREQLRRARQVLDDLGGVRLFRPPFGHQSFLSRIDILWMGYKVVTWNRVAEDWLGKSAEEMFNKSTRKLKPGCILLFHDKLDTFLNRSNENRSEMIKTIQMLLENYRDQYRFVTVPNLLQAGKPVCKNWLRAPDLEWVDSYKQNYKKS
jgi:peptidoglycan/xylan/chitin deacetylase (PgdA/CDA1 family)